MQIDLIRHGINLNFYINKISISAFLYTIDVILTNSDS